MNSSPHELRPPAAAGVDCSADSLVVRLTDGRSISVPLAWYPRLARATAAQRAHWQLTGAGFGIHWPELDEDISVAALLEGRPSGESAASLARSRPPMKAR